MNTLIYLLCNMNLLSARQRSITMYRDWACGNGIAPTRTAWFLYYCSILQIALEQNSVVAPSAPGHSDLCSFWTALGNRCWQPWAIHGGGTWHQVPEVASSTYQLRQQVAYTQSIRMWIPIRFLHSFPRSFDRSAPKTWLISGIFPLQTHAAEYSSHLMQPWCFTKYPVKFNIPFSCKCYGGIFYQESWYLIHAHKSNYRSKGSCTEILDH